MKRKKAVYKDELIAANRPIKVVCLGELLRHDQREDADPSDDVVLHNTMRFDVHLPYFHELELSEMEMAALTKKIKAAIFKALPKGTYMMDDACYTHGKSAMLYRCSLVRAYD
jgi:hypothetical protein